MAGKEQFMKRTRIVASVCTGVMCLALLIIGVWAAVIANFGISTKLTFNPNGVYVELSGQIYRGASYTELEPLLDDPSYTLEPCKNYTIEEAVDGSSTSTTYSLSEWTPNELLFLPSEKMLQFRLSVKNFGEKDICLLLTSNTDYMFTGNYEGVFKFYEEAGDTLRIESGQTKEYRFAIEVTSDITFNKLPLELNFDIVNIEDIQTSATYFTVNSSNSSQIDACSSAYTTGKYGGDVCVIPDQINGVEITSIKENSSVGESAKYIILPRKMETIGRNAFSSNSQLKAIAIPDTVRTMDSIVSGCGLIVTLHIPDGVTSIGDFENCYSLIRLDLPEGLLSIGTFNGCSSLITLNIPNSVTSIGHFNDCSSLKSLTIPGGTGLSGSEEKFSRCTALEEVIILEGVTEMGEACFDSCPNLKKVILPKSIVKIDKYAFGGEGCNIDIYFEGAAPKIFIRLADEYGNIDEGSFAPHTRNYKFYVKSEYLSTFQQGTSSNMEANNASVNNWYYYQDKIETYK